MRLHQTLLVLFLCLLAQTAKADTYLLVSVTASGVTTNPGQYMQTTSTGATGFSPTLTPDSTPAYFYTAPVTGAYSTGTWQFVMWSNSPGCSAPVYAEVGYSNPDGSNYIELGSTTVDVNATGAGNHTSAFSFTGIPFLNLSGQVLRLEILQTSGCAVSMAYNGGLDFNTRLITTPLGPGGTATISPTLTLSPTSTPTFPPALVKSVNVSNASMGETLTYTLSYRNPNATVGSTCQDTFESASTNWPSGWTSPTGGTWALTADNGPTLPGSSALGAQEVGGFNYTDINCAGQVTDGSIQSDIKDMTTNGELSLLWRQNGSSTYQIHIIQGNSANISLRVITNGSFNELISVSYPINLDQWYTVKLVVQGFTLQGYINGALVISATDPNSTFNSGAAGLEIDDGASLGMQAEFDNVIINDYAVNWYNVNIVDTLPAGLTYVSNSCGATESGGVVTYNVGTLTAGTLSSCNVIAVVNACPGTLVNQAQIQVGLPAQEFSSNNVTTTVSCYSPTESSTATPTESPSATPSSSATTTLSSTPSASPTVTQTESFSDTTTETPSCTGTGSSTQTSTPSATPTWSLTDTPTASSTSTLTVSSSATATSTLTVSTTSTPSSTCSPSPSSSPSLSPSATVTGSPTVSLTPSASLTPSPTPSVTLTATPTTTPTQSSTLTDSPTASLTSTSSPSATVTWTLTQSPTPSATPTASPTVSNSVTLTNSPTISDTPTVSPSYTVSPTVTLSPTITPTPVTLPMNLQVVIYNSAGEIVKHLYSGGSQAPSGNFTLSTTAFIQGSSGVSVMLGGKIQGGGDSLIWSGANDGNQPVSGGIYTIQVVVTNSFGSTQSWTQSVSVLPQSSFQSINIYNSAGELVDTINPSTFTSQSLSSIGFPSGSNADFVVGSGSDVKFEMQSESGGSVETSWDGRSSNGQTVSSGSYLVQLVDTNGGNQIVASKGFEILSIPLQGFSVQAGPNPIGPENKLLVFRLNGIAPGQVPCAKLYNMAGELVAKSSGSLGANKLVMSVGNWSAGVYVAAIEADQNNAVVSRQICRIAVVR